MTLQSVNPATDEVLASYDWHSAAEVDQRLQRSADMWRDWRSSPLRDRAKLLVSLADVLTARRETYAALITAEMGKPIREALAEVDKCAASCRQVAEFGPPLLADQHVATEASQSFVRYDPVGPVLAIMPWNYPFWQVLRCFASAALAGNPVVLKHAENTLGCAYALEQAVTDAGAPGLLQALVVPTAAVADVIADDRIRSVTVTGSVRAGRSVGAAAGGAGKPVVLELGGSDPLVVLDDADLGLAVDVAVRSRFGNAGQSCIAAKRFLVHSAVHDEFLQRLEAAVSALTVGDPTRQDTDLGPLARGDLRAALADQVARSLEAGARPVVAGGVVDGPGAFFAPTVLADPDPTAAGLQEETFGPLAVVASVSSDDEALGLANSTRYGLGASVFTSSPDRAQRFVTDLDAGAVFVNDLVRSDPRLPFGGVKDSGHGRELGELGVRTFTSAKTVWVA